MRRATLYTFSALIISALILTGCGTVSANSTITNASHHNSNTQSQTSSKPTYSTEINSQSIKTGGYNLNQSTSQGQCIGKLYSVLGEITKVNQTQSGIQSIQLLAIKSIMPRGSYEPLQQLKSYTIYFDQPKSELPSLQLIKGAIIKVSFGQYVPYSDPKKRTIPVHAGWIWGSNFDWVKVLGAFNVKSYVSAANAIGAITSLEQSNGKFYPSGPEINLGLGIKAEFSGGAGQYSYKWNEGRWIVLTQFWGGGAGNQVIKDMVAYLHTHMLPAPENRGIILIQQPSFSNMPLKVTQNIIAWQVGDKVHQLRYTGNPIQALQIVVNSRKA